MCGLRGGMARGTGECAQREAEGESRMRGLHRRRPMDRRLAKMEARRPSVGDPPPDNGLVWSNVTLVILPRTDATSPPWSRGLESRRLHR